MNRLANVVVAASDPSLIDALINALSEQNCTALAHDTVEDALAEARASQPDLVLIEQSDETGGFPGFQLAEALAQDDLTLNIPKVLVAAAPVPELFRRAQMLGVDDVVAGPVSVDELFERLRPLFRLSTMRAELSRRAQLARADGIELDVRAGQRDGKTLPAVLTGGLSEVHYVRVVEALDDRTALACVGDLTEAADLLDTPIFDLALIELSKNRDEVFALCGQIRQNPRLYNLPVVILADSEHLPDPIEAYRQGATRVLRPPFDLDELRHVVSTLSRRQRMRWALRGAIEKGRQPAVCDPRTGLHSFAFLRRHLEMLIETARQWSKHLTLVFFTFPNMGEIRARFGDEAAERLVAQLGGWINGLIRVEDLVARYEGDDYCVSLPDTPIEEARIVMQRIAGILRCTDFAVFDVYQPLVVFVEVGMASLEPEDSADDLIARAREQPS